MMEFELEENTHFVLWFITAEFFAEDVGIKSYEIIKLTLGSQPLVVRPSTFDNNLCEV